MINNNANALCVGDTRHSEVTISLTKGNRGGLPGNYVNRASCGGFGGYNGRTAKGYFKKSASLRWEAREKTDFCLEKPYCFQQGGSYRNRHRFIWHRFQHSQHAFFIRSRRAWFRDDSYFHAPGALLLLYVSTESMRSGSGAGHCAGSAQFM